MSVRDECGDRGRVAVVRARDSDEASARKAIRAFKTPASERPFDATGLARFLARPQNVLLIAWWEGEPVGFLLAYELDRVDRDRPMVCLYEIEVAATHRRRGIGRALVQALLAHCRDIGAAKAWVVTDRANRAAVGLYEGAGARANPDGDDVVYAWSERSWLGADPRDGSAGGRAANGAGTV
jgi:ribosomal protein S18 acetylase RimI-like enzyme